LRLQLGTLGGQHLLAIALGDLVRVDPAHRQVLQAALQRFAQVRGRVGGGQVHGQATVGQFNRHGSRQRGLAHTAFAHQHDQAVPFLGDVIHEGRQARGLERCGNVDRGSVGRRCLVGQQMLQGVQPDQIEGLELDLIARQVAQGRWQVGQRGRFPRLDRRSQRIVGTFPCWHQAVDHQMLARQADGCQLIVGAGCFTQGAALGAGHQHQSGPQGI